MLDVVGGSLAHPGLFQSVLMTARVGGPASDTVSNFEFFYVAPEGNELRGKVSSTQSLHLVHWPSDTSAASMRELNAGNFQTDTTWADDAVRSPGWVAAAKRLDEASMFDDGWSGPESCAADRGALLGAHALLAELEQVIPAAAAPKVGLDSDGLPLLSWRNGGLVGSLSVFDTDTYAYYIERDDRAISCEEARLSQPLSVDLVNFLSV